MKLRSLVSISLGFCTVAMAQASQTPRAPASEPRPVWSFSRLDGESARVIPEALLRAGSAGLRYPTQQGEFVSAAQHARQTACLKSQEDELKRYLTPERATELEKKGVSLGRIRIGLIDSQDPGVQAARAKLRRELEQRLEERNPWANLYENVSVPYPLSNYLPGGAVNDRIQQRIDAAFRQTRDRMRQARREGIARFMASDEAKAWIERSLRGRLAGGAPKDSKIPEIENAFERAVSSMNSLSARPELREELYRLLPPAAFGQGADLAVDTIFDESASRLIVEGDAEAAYRASRERDETVHEIVFAELLAADLEPEQRKEIEQYVQFHRSSIVDRQRDTELMAGFMKRKRSLQPFLGTPSGAKPEAGAALAFPDTLALGAWLEGAYEVCGPIRKATGSYVQVERDTSDALMCQYTAFAQDALRVTAQYPDQELFLRAELDAQGACVKMDAAGLARFFADAEQGVLKKREAAFDPAEFMRKVAAANRKQKELDDQFLPTGGGSSGGAIHP